MSLVIIEIGCAGGHFDRLTMESDDDMSETELKRCWGDFVKMADTVANHPSPLLGNVKGGCLLCGLKVSFRVLAPVEEEV